MTVLRLSFALACLLLVGCGPLWNAANRSGLEADVRQLLEAAGFVPQHLDCRMVGSTRDAACSLHMSAAGTASVIGTFALERIDLSSEPPSNLARLVADAGPSCVVAASARLSTYGISGRPDSLRLPSGSAFEYLLLTVDESTGQACVQVSYAYG